MSKLDVSGSLVSGGLAGRRGRPCLRVGSCRVDADLDRIVAGGREVAIEPKVMAVLMYLAQHPDRVVSASELIEQVWKGRPMGDNPVYRCIAQLRRALGDDPRAPTYIATVPTKGYRLIAPVEPLEPPTPAAGDAWPTGVPAARWQGIAEGLAVLLLLALLAVMALLLR